MLPRHVLSRQIQSESPEPGHRLTRWSPAFWVRSSQQESPGYFLDAGYGSIPRRAVFFMVQGREGCFPSSCTIVTLVQRRGRCTLIGRGRDMAPLFSLAGERADADWPVPPRYHFGGLGDRGKGGVSTPWCGAGRGSERFETGSGSWRFASSRCE